MKSDLELLKLLLDHAESEPGFYGLCSVVNRMYSTYYVIPFTEFYQLKGVIKSLPHPTQKTNGYWWPKGRKAPRVRWLKKQIKIMEDNQ